MAISPPLIAYPDQNSTSKRRTEEVHTPSHLPDPPAAWAWKRLDHLCIGTFDCPHSTPELAPNGPYVVRTQDIRTGTLRLEETAHVSETTYAERVARAEPRRGDILYSREGTYFGIAAEVPPGVKLCLGQRMFLIRPNQDVCDHRFLKYWLNSPVMSGHIAGYRDGSVAERLNLPTIRSLPVVVPPLSEQRAIAHILGTLDDKIEVNRRMSATLEAMARALFKSWFVDFEPVRAKAEGRDPGLPPQLASLFPNRLIETQDGEIPEGWKTKPIGSVADFFSGGTPRKSEPRYWNGDVPWISPKSLEGIHVSDAADRVTEAAIGNGTRLAPDRSILVMVRGMGLHQGLRIAQARRQLAFNQDVKALVPTEVDSVFLLLGLIVSEFELFTQVKPAGHGTGVLETETLRSIKLHCPPAKQASRFVTILSGLNERIALNHEETLTLAALRDTLLPRLISGELRVSQAARMVEAVGRRG